MSIQSSRLQYVVFIFVPLYDGIKGNDRADGLARSVPIVKGKEVDRVDIRNAIRDSCRDECPGSLLDSTSLTRVIGPSVTRGIARNKNASEQICSVYIECHYSEPRISTHVPVFCRMNLEKLVIHPYTVLRN